MKYWIIYLKTSNSVKKSNSLLFTFKNIKKKNEQVLYLILVVLFLKSSKYELVVGLVIGVFLLNSEIFTSASSLVLASECTINVPNPPVENNYYIIQYEKWS